MRVNVITEDTTTYLRTDTAAATANQEEYSSMTISRWTAEDTKLEKRAARLGLCATALYTHRLDYKRWQIDHLNAAQLRHLIDLLEASGGLPALTAGERAKKEECMRGPPRRDAASAVIS